MAEVKRKRKPRAKQAEEQPATETQATEEFQPIESPIDEVPEIKEEPVKPKVTKVTLPPKTQDQPKVERVMQRNSGMFRVFVRGVERWLTKSAVEVASKDPSLRLEIPEDTDFELPNVRKCKDC